MRRLASCSRLCNQPGVTSGGLSDIVMCSWRPPCARGGLMAVWADRRTGVFGTIASVRGLVVINGRNPMEGPLAVLMMQAGLALPANMHLAHEEGHQHLGSNETPA